MNTDKKKESFLKKLFRPSRSGCCSIRIINEDEEKNIEENRKETVKEEK